MVDFLAENSLFLLFLVVAIGYPFGRISIGGSSFGVATVLFAGLAVGAIDPRLKLPEIVYQIGLVFFVYIVGLSAGRGFFAFFRVHGLRNTAWVSTLLLLSAAMVAAEARLLDLTAPSAAGLFSGSMTNTPSLAGILENLANRYSGPAAESILAEPMIAYSIAYPVAIIGMMAAVLVVQKALRIDYREEAKQVRGSKLFERNQDLATSTVLVTNPDAALAPVGELNRDQGWEILFSRVGQGGRQSLATAAMVLQPGDLVTLIGEAAEVERVTSWLGEPT